ncbi:MAG: bifunctional metallophosphatase/5'-nucleotidase [bacterium]|nr:MAG: bifunctional metallophosphatase/5'-nucleotidase [bacterium]
MRKINIFFVLLFLGCAATRVTVPPEPMSDSITILHTNDIHGAFQPVVVKAKRPDQKDREIGGVLALNYYAKKIRNESNNVLLLDAGDFMTGNPICDIEYDGAIGGPMVKFFNYIGYEGLTPGNHDFDISVINAKKLFDLCVFPVFSANLFNKDGALLTAEPFQIYSKGDVVIGVIGTIVEDLPDYLNKPQRDEIFAKPAAPIIDSLAKIIDPLTDLIVVISHSGLEADKELAQQLGSPVDVIIGGHSHDRLEQVVKVNRKLIVQTGIKLRNLGRLDLTVAADTVKDFTYQLIPLWSDEIKPDTVLMKEVKKYQQLIDQEYDRVIGELKAPWERSYYAESNIGNYIADCMRKFSGADFALINSGGIRQNLPIGSIKKLDAKNILPFSNSITKFTVTGKEFIKLIYHNAMAAATQSNGILQVSGLKYEYKVVDDDSVEILSAIINDNPIDPDKTYQGATVDFVITNAEKYLGFVPTDVTDLMMPLTDVVMKAIEEQKVIDSKVEERIVRKN